MAGGVSVKITGDVEVQRALHGIATELEDLDSFDQVAGEYARIVSGFAPRRTGRLAGSAQGRAVRNKAVVIVTAPYASVQNYGSPRRNIPASHFMQRADEVMVPRAVEKIDGQIDSAIRRKGLR